MKSKEAKKEKKVINRKSILPKKLVKGPDSGEGKKVEKKVSTNLYDKKGKIVGKVSLPADIFAVKINPVLLAQAVRVYLANQRMGTASTKTRGEVKGSTRKIYRQKGTGKARHGSIRAPIFVGGGIVFGPSPRDFSLKLSKKARRKAIFAALSQKLQEEKIFVIDSLVEIKPKTKEMLEVLTALKITPGDKEKKDNFSLLVLPEPLENVIKAARNIEGLNIRMVNSLSCYEILKNKNIVFLQASIEALSKIFLKN